MKILVACEFSGRVRDAFTLLDHEAISCDLLPSDTPGPHHVGDVRDLLGEKWDLLLAFPPCTYLASSGARWWASRQAAQKEALNFIRLLMSADIPYIAIENPIGRISTAIRPPDQIIQPWMFGHGETKATCLWLKNLPKLKPTNVVEGREPKVHMCSPGPNRWRKRSITYLGIAKAMAEQWGPLRAGRN